MRTDHYAPKIPPERLRRTVEEFEGVELVRQETNTFSYSVEATLTRTVDGAEYTTEVCSNASTWAGQGPAPLSMLVERLSAHPLDRTHFSRFAFQLKEKDLVPAHARLIGWWEFFGNFFDYSHVFRIYTNDPHVIEQLRSAIRSNQNRASYKALPAYVSPPRRRRSA